jgi:hypothetical protein
MQGPLFFARRTPKDLRRVDMRIQEFKFKNQEIDVSGVYVLGTIGLAFLVMVPVVWAFVRYWLFAP